MQEVTLNGPRVINGAVRYPVEGPIVVTDEEHDRLVEAGAIDTDAEDEPGEDGLDDESVADLKSLAELEEIDLGGATRKAAIIAAIRAHRANAE